MAGTKLRRWESTASAERTGAWQKAVAPGRGRGMRSSRQVLTGRWNYTERQFTSAEGREGVLYKAQKQCTEYLKGKVLIQIASGRLSG